MERLNTLLTAIFLFSLSFSAFAEPKVDTTPNPFGNNAQEEAPILKKKKPKSSNQSCGTKTLCREMESCAEACHYLNDCGLSRLDGDSDGKPCEKLCKQGC